MELGGRGKKMVQGCQERRDEAAGKVAEGGFF